MSTRAWWVWWVLGVACADPAEDPVDARDSVAPQDTDEAIDLDTGPLPHDGPELFSSPSIQTHGRLTPSSRVACGYTYRVPHAQIAREKVRWINLTAGVELGEGNPFQLQPGKIGPYDQLRCRVRLVDVAGHEHIQRASRPMEGPRPVITHVRITPDVAHIERPLTCQASVTHEARYAVTTAFSWRNLTRGTSLGTGADRTITGDEAAVGDEIACDVQARDRHGSMVTQTTTATIAERPPELGPITLVPSDPKVGEVVTCQATATHPDGLPVEMSSTWTNLTTHHQTSSPDLSLTLDPEHFETGHQVRCEVAARGVDRVSGRSRTFSIDVENNRPPVVLDVRIDPPGPLSFTDPLVCSAEAVDPDGTEPLLSYRWTNPSRSGYGAYGQAVLPPQWASVGAGEDLRCTVTATDGTLSDTAYAEVRVLSAPPVLLFADIAPRPLVSPDAVLECTVAVISPGQNTLLRSYTWRNLTTGELLGESLRLDLAEHPDVAHSDVIGCEVEVSEPDGEVSASFSVLVDASTSLGEVGVSPTLGGLRYIPAGTYVRGCDPDRELRQDLSPWIHGVGDSAWHDGGQLAEAPCDPADRASAVWDTPAHPVTLTRSLWVTEGPIGRDTVSATGRRPPFFHGPNPHIRAPWVGSWSEALDFANHASALDGLPPCYDLQQCAVFWPGMHEPTREVCDQVDVLSPTGSVLDCEGWRLPTDAEWEYLARGGEDELPDVPWDDLAILRVALASIGYMWEPLDFTECLVGPNAFGLCDAVVGAGPQWVWDRRQPYPDPPPSGGLVDPVDPHDPAHPVTRWGPLPFVRWRSDPGRLAGMFLLRTAE